MEPKKITYQEAMARDAILYDLARYDAMGGQIPFADNPEEIMKIQIETIKNTALLFNKYKKLIRMGEYSFEEMVDDILARNAAFEQPKDTINLNSDKELNTMVSLFEKNLAKKENNDAIADLTDKLQKVLLGYKENNPSFNFDKKELKSDNPSNPSSKKSNKSKDKLNEKKPDDSSEEKI